MRRTCKHCGRVITIVANQWGIADNPSATSGDTKCYTRFILYGVVQEDDNFVLANNHEPEETP